MFDREIERSAAGANRRVFLLAAVPAAAGVAVVLLRTKGEMPEVASAAGLKPPLVRLVRFGDDGKRLQEVRVPKLVRSEAEWRQRLPAGVFQITRRADTEIAYTGAYWNQHEPGLYRCVCCDNALFSSATKFDSGTGWPSFWAPIAEENLYTSSDRSLGVSRDEVLCTECDAHLGHVFDDGPPPTGLRYCMNSASLRFVRKS
jgi:peptide-methionine (R)-S-oxide reductase